MTQHPYGHMNWDGYATVPSPSQRRTSKAARIFLTLCALAIAAGVLVALAN